MKEFEKQICILAHIYDFLSGGYFASHNQLMFYDKKIYNLYLKNNKDKLNNLYNNLRKEIPTNIVEVIEKSAGIRYFLCDGCHDAQIKGIKNIEKDGLTDYLIINLDTAGMLGCLNLKDTNCKIIIETTKKEENKIIIDDFDKYQRVFWISNDVVFGNDCIYFELELEAFTSEQYERLNYKFKIYNIFIE